MDSGSPQLTGSAFIYVTVLDVNDQPPQFDQSNYTAVVQVCMGQTDCLTIINCQAYFSLVSYSFERGFTKIRGKKQSVVH